jgi:heme-degrading monooxygenase HmoA
MESRDRHSLSALVACFLHYLAQVNKLEAILMAATKKGAQTVLEAGFKMIPGKETDFLAFQNKMVTVAMQQEGFGAVYGGPILDSTWVYFGVRFDSEEQMDAWHRHPQHQAAQKSAYAKWWTDVYIRKWLEPAPGETLGDRLMSESRVFVDTPFNEEQMKVARQALAELSAFGAIPFETHTGEFESQPYQFVGPIELAPAAEKVIYSLIAHWSSAEHFNDWRSSGSCQALQSLGEVSSELFVALKEARPRDHLRDDKLQREWTLKGGTRR